VILADSSVWIDHFRKPIGRVQELARDGRMCAHPFVTGELAAGSLHLKHRIILMLRHLPQLRPVMEDAYYAFLEKYEVNGKGLGFVDIHLLAATSQAEEVQLWTHDRRMFDQALRLGLAYQP
jgi:predicted nucleic acid-binding protein